MFVTFDVPFVRGKDRPRFARMGRGVRAYTSNATARAEDAIRNAYVSACVSKYGHAVMAPEHVPVYVYISTERELPKSRPKRLFRERDTYKPDIDNTLKCVLDAINGVAWVDDAQVTQAHVIKLDRTRGRGDMTHVLVMWKGEEDG